jgi:hypothetical protein
LRTIQVSSQSRRPGLALRLLTPLLISVLAGGCSGGDEPSSAGVAASQLIHALGCDHVERANYESWPLRALETRPGRDCLKDDVFVARMHVLESHEVVGEAVAYLRRDRYGDPPPEHMPPGCWQGPRLVQGSTWILVTNSERLARTAGDATGGEVLPPMARNGPVVSYNLPCPDPG